MRVTHCATEWRVQRYVLLLAVLACLLPLAVKAEVLQGRVVAVTDGDTVRVLSGGRTELKVRIAGIDAPEKRQPYGAVSKQMLSALVYGQTVSVEWHKVDQYGRLIGKVFVGDRDVALLLVQRGLAWHYKRFESEQSAADRSAYSAAEADAHLNRRGLWRDEEPIPPWEFRKSRR